MTDANQKLPISVDYTSRDFYSLREDLITRVKANIPTWLGNDPADFGMALIEAFAYMGDIANYYIDRVANESFISTATQRSSILKYAKERGYTVDGYRSSTTVLSFGNSKSTAITLPAKTIVYADVVYNDEIKRIKFSTDTSITIPAGRTVSSNLSTCSATQGYDVGSVKVTENAGGVNVIKVATTNGQANQSYSLDDNNVVDNSLYVYLKDGTIFVKWTEVTDLSLYGKNDRVYTRSIDENDYIVISFGDGISGAIPPSGNVLYAAYNLGDGVFGNLVANTISTSTSPLVYVPGYSDVTSFTPYITVTNKDIAVGGAHPESNASIRANASSMTSGFQRAVTLSDYERLCFLAPNLGKAKAYSLDYSSVSLFISPKREAGYIQSSNLNTSDLYPGWNSDKSAITTEMSTLIADVTSSLADYTQIGITTTVSPVYYTLLEIAYTFTPSIGYSTLDVQTAIEDKLLSTFSYQNAAIAGYISKDMLVREINSITGVTSCSITTLKRTSGTNESELVGKPGEVFVINKGTPGLVGTVSSTGRSLLTGLSATVSSGTVTQSPSFSSSTLSYTFTVSSSSTITIIPTNTDSATITVAGSVTTTGTGVTLSISVGLNTTTVVVTNPNTGIKTTYGITILRSA